ncbi:MAG: hypothetical protein LBM66_03230 [Bifidobacteriaceae bacterium]|jgi:uncharacterized protein (DUF2267 family)|nr:hypothetical protein [Bifidobacteriaceae bacterium]
MSSKRRCTFTLDEDVAQYFQTSDRTSSAQVNAVLRREMEAGQRQESLAELVHDLEELWGPADPAEVDRIGRLMR